MSQNCTPSFDQLVKSKGGATPNFNAIVDPPHPGFKSVQASIARKEGISKDRAGAILGAATRRAGAAARRANPRLNRVKG
jgi:hypothetical protein